MNKKHFVLIAAALADAREHTHTESGMLTIDRVVRQLCMVFEQINPNFDEAKFREAVYGDDDE